MKICFIVGAFPTMKCGVGDYCSKVAKELAKNGHEIYVITSKKASPEVEGLKVFNIICGYKYYKKLTLLHTTVNKITGLILLALHFL